MAKKIKEISFDLCEPIIKDMGYELVEVDYVKENGGMSLIFYVDAENGITVDDCEKITRAIEEPLDELNPTDDKPYTLVVSSLGIDRPLKLKRDFEKNINKEIEIKFYAPHKELKTKEIKGVLKDFDDDFITIELNGNQLKLERKLIALIAPIINL